MGGHVLFAGVVENAKVPDWLAACDVFVLPSLNEGRSNAVIEALACGLPVVVSDRSFNREFLREDFAVFVDPMNPDAIGSGIQFVLNDQARYTLMSKNARRAAESYSLADRAKMFLNGLEK